MKFQLAKPLRPAPTVHEISHNRTLEEVWQMEGKITLPQARYIQWLCHKAHTEVPDLVYLSKAEASLLIDHLKKKLGMRNPVRGSPILGSSRYSSDLTSGLYHRNRQEELTVEVKK